MTDPPSFEEIEVPDLAEPIRAWRTWRVVFNGSPPFIVGARSNPWRTPEHAAKCQPYPCSPHRPCGNPPVYHQCGIYAYQKRPVGGPRLEVHGEVLLWGRVIIGTLPNGSHGYQASRARIEHLIAPSILKNADWATCRAIADNLGVPIEQDQERRAA